MLTDPSRDAAALPRRDGGRQPRGRGHRRRRRPGRRRDGRRRAALRPDRARALETPSRACGVEPGRVRAGHRAPPRNVDDRGAWRALVELLLGAAAGRSSCRCTRAPARALEAAGLLERARGRRPCACARRSATSTSRRCCAARAVPDRLRRRAEGGLPRRRAVRDAARHHRVGRDGRRRAGTCSSTSTPARRSRRWHAPAPPAERPQLYGDGRAAERIACRHRRLGQPAVSIRPMSARSRSSARATSGFRWPSPSRRPAAASPASTSTPRASPSWRPAGSHVEDVPGATLARLVEAGSIAATTDYAAVADAEAILICVPTPLTENREPDCLDHRQRHRVDPPAPAAAASWWCSSRPPTRAPRGRCCSPCWSATGLVAGRDFHLAMSPERIDPGRTDFTVRTTPKVVGGLTPACLDRAVALYCDLRRPARAGVLAGRGRAGQAAREHLPQRQHRAGQRAGDARATGWASTSGRWSTPRPPSRSASCASARARAWAATASRSTPSTCRGAPASSTSRPSSSSSPARSTRTCPTTAPSGSAGR